MGDLLIECEKKIDSDGKEEVRNFESDLKKKIKTYKTTKLNRINMSKRLTGYSHKWKLLFFVFNLLAVIFVILSLKSTYEFVDIYRWKVDFDVLAGLFTIYVIMLQYYINGLNYEERSLRAHYHQLEIEDLILKLQELTRIYSSLDHEDQQAREEVMTKFHEITENYQLIMKNNENHHDTDYKKAQYTRKLKAHKAIKEAYRKLQIDKKEQRKSSLYERTEAEMAQELEIEKAYQLKKRPGYIRQIDLTLDMWFLYVNGLLSILMLGILLFTNG